MLLLKNPLTIFLSSFFLFSHVTLKKRGICVTPSFIGRRRIIVNWLKNFFQLTDSFGSYREDFLLVQARSLISKLEEDNNDESGGI